MLAVLFAADGTIVAREKRKTSERAGADLIEAIAETIEAVVADGGLTLRDVESIGVAVPGPVDAHGVILQTANLGLDGVELGPELASRLKLTTNLTIENDVNAGLWAEHIAGAARGYQTICGIFPGTGIGGAIIVDGALVRGCRGGAGEIGHLTVQSDGRLCGCGNFGCLETVASKTAIARDLAVLALNGSSPVLVAARATDISLMRSGLIARALESGDERVAEVVDRAADFLGIGMAALVNIINPEVIVIGGGLVEKLGSRITDRASAMMRHRAMRDLVADVSVVEAACGDDAVAIGAADLARRANGRRVA